jgi:hypothetical protein
MLLPLYVLTAEYASFAAHSLQSLKYPTLTLTDFRWDQWKGLPSFQETLKGIECPSWFPDPGHRPFLEGDSCDDAQWNPNGRERDLTILKKGSESREGILSGPSLRAFLLEAGIEASGKRIQVGDFELELVSHLGRGAQGNVFTAISVTTQPSGALGLSEEMVLLKIFFTDSVESGEEAYASEVSVVEALGKGVVHDDELLLSVQVYRPETMNLHTMMESLNPSVPQEFALLKTLSLLFIQQVESFSYRTGFEHGDASTDNAILFKNVKGQWAVEMIDFGLSKPVTDRDDAAQNDLRFALRELFVDFPSLKMTYRNFVSK